MLYIECCIIRYQCSVFHYVNSKHNITCILLTSNVDHILQPWSTMVYISPTCYSEQPLHLTLAHLPNMVCFSFFYIIISFFFIFYMLFLALDGVPCLPGLQTGHFKSLSDLTLDKELNQSSELHNEFIQVIKHSGGMKKGSLNMPKDFFHFKMIKIHNECG